jgi:hypothetical protein
MNFIKKHKETHIVSYDPAREKKSNWWATVIFMILFSLFMLLIVGIPGAIFAVVLVLASGAGYNDRIDDQPRRL